MNTILQFMKKNYKLLLVVSFVSLSLLAFKSNFSSSSDPEKDKLLIELLTFVLEKGHYSPATMDDEFSKGVYKDYIEALDPSKRFFLQADIDEFSKYELELDDQLLNKDLKFFDLTYTRLIQRIEESKSIYKSILNQPFDYTIDESFNTDYEKMPYAKNTSELKERWRKQIKLSTLSSLVDRQEIQDSNGVIDKDLKAVAAPLDEESDFQDAAETENKKEVAVTKDKKKSFDELEKETRESSLKSLDEYFGFIKDLTRKDYFSVYLNSVTSKFDPHTNYLAPEDKERFDVSMSGKLEGIGARLQKKNDYTEISELI